MERSVMSITPLSSRSPNVNLTSGSCDAGVAVGAGVTDSVGTGDGDTSAVGTGDGDVSFVGSGEGDGSAVGSGEGMLACALLFAK